MTAAAARPSASLWRQRTCVRWIQAGSGSGSGSGKTAIRSRVIWGLIDWGYSLVAQSLVAPEPASAMGEASEGQA